MVNDEVTMDDEVEEIEQEEHDEEAGEEDARVKVAMAPVSVRPLENSVSKAPGSNGASVSLIIRRSSVAGRRPRCGG